MNIKYINFDFFYNASTFLIKANNSRKVSPIGKASLRTGSLFLAVIDCCVYGLLESIVSGRGEVAKTCFIMCSCFLPLRIQ